MKRGVVVKQSRRSTIVLTSEGVFLEINAQEQAAVGQEVEFSAQELVRRTRVRHWTPSMKNFMRVAVLVLVFVLAIFPVYSWYIGGKAYAYVSLDFNPSIELKVNNRMDVVSVAALNEDARAVIAALDEWQGEPVEKVAASILRKSSDLGLLTDSESIIIGVNYIGAKQEDKQLTNILEGSVNRFNDTLHIASFQVPDAVRETAQEEQKSMNEIMAQSIMEEDDAPKLDSALTQSDSAIIKDFYKDDVQDEESPEEEVSRQTKESLDTKPAYTVTEPSVKEKENTGIKTAEGLEKPQESDQSKGFKKQMKEVEKQAKEARKQAGKEARKHEKTNTRPEANEANPASEQERKNKDKDKEKEKHKEKDSKHHGDNRKEQRGPGSSRNNDKEKDKNYHHEQQGNNGKSVPPGLQDRRNEQPGSKEKQKNSEMD
ncbi:anti-sigma factor domain-containing protein [Terribacillus saccharophilus]|uniref:anti-sigma factor domain-containing protein n=1 Tax=Terribacillus saccharophilus TaxID=361277 RepID=UPI003981B8BF